MISVVPKRSEETLFLDRDCLLPLGIKATWTWQGETKPGGTAKAS